MARRSGGGRPAPRAAPRPAPMRNAPQPAAHAPPPAPIQQSGGGSMLGSIGSTIAQGMAFGTGSAVAHRAVDAVLGPRTVQQEVVEAPAAAQSNFPAVTNLSGTDSCGVHSKAFQDCLNNYGSDISKCQFYLDMLNECRRGSSTSGIMFCYLVLIPVLFYNSCLCSIVSKLLVGARGKELPRAVRPLLLPAATLGVPSHVVPSLAGPLHRLLPPAAPSLVLLLSAPGMVHGGGVRGVNEGRAAFIYSSHPLPRVAGRGESRPYIKIILRKKKATS
eukprot:Gb_18280 [translate_table: standard]